MFHAVQLILTIDIIREFVMSLQVINYAKQNGAQMATFAATGTRADIDDQRKTMAALGTRLKKRYKEGLKSEIRLRLSNRNALQNI